MNSKRVLYKGIVSVILVLAVLAAAIVPAVCSTENLSPLKDKNILFVGDSIAAGWRDEAYGGNFTNEGGWAARIADLYGAEVTNAATAGSPLSTIRESENRPAIVNQLHLNKDGNFDYIILQGGFNDAMGTNANPTKETAAKVGEMTDSFEATDFDTSTFAGALEDLFFYAKEYFPKAKVGFIINYATPLSTYGGYTAEEDAMREYWNMAKAVCDKWGISYLDLFDGKTADGKSYSYDILDVNTSNNFPGGNDNIHLNAAGYDVITPYIASWIPTTSAVSGGYSLKWENSVPADAIVHLDFEEQYLYNEAHAFTNNYVYYDESYAENWNGNGLANNRGNNSMLWTGIDGNTAVQFTWDNPTGSASNENYNANGLMNIYDPSTKSTFIGEAGKWYNFTFKVKVTKNNNVPLQFYLATSGRTYLNNGQNGTQSDFQTTDCNFNHINAMRTATSGDLRVYKAGNTFTAPTDGWVTVSANWYADGTHFPILGVTANNKTKVTDLTNFESPAVLVDEIIVTETTDFVQDFENVSTFYDGTVNKTADSVRGTNAVIGSLDDGNTVVKFNWDGEQGRNYNDANAITILNPLTSSKFVGESGKTYTISFDYKVTNTDGQFLQFYISACGRGFLSGTDMGPLAMQTGTSPEPSYKTVTDKITTVSADWQTATATFTANGTHYPVIILQVNGKNAVSGAPTTGNFASAIIDNVIVKVVKDNVSTTGFDLKLNKNDHSVFYNDGGANNWTSASGRGNNANWTTDGDNSVIRFTWDSDNSNENYGANNAMKILDPSTGNRFMGEVGTEYVVNFKYKVENTDGKTLNFYLAPCNRIGRTNPSWASSDLGGTDLGPKATIANATTTFIQGSTVNTDGEWHTAYVNWTGRAQINGYDVYPLILLEANGKTADTSKTSGFASVLIDDINVTKNINGTIPAYNYDGGDVTLLNITRSTTFANLITPERKGWIFDGFYTNAALTEKAEDSARVGEYKAIYVKWSGDGNAMTPNSVKDALSFSAMKAFDSAKFTTVTENWNGSPLYDVESLGISLNRDKQTEQVGTSNVSGWKGEYVLSADTMVENYSQAVVLDNVLVTTPANSIMLYIELPDFAAADKTYALSLGKRGICLLVNGTSWTWTRAKDDGTSTFAYTDEGEWKSGTLSADGAFMGLPTGYKGYIRFDFDTLSSNIDFNTSSYKFSCIELEPNVLGGYCGDLVLGGIVYVPAERTNSTVWQVKNTISSSEGTYNYLYYDVATSNVGMGVNPYAVYSDKYAFSTRYSGTAASPAIKLTEKETSAFWATAPVSITTLSGEQETTTGYMSTYSNSDASVTLQPGVDSFMFYVELPSFTESDIFAPLKLLDTTLTQSGVSKTLSFANSYYEFASVYDGVWNSARAGADGDLKDIPSGFKGFIKFCVKDFKNYNEISCYDANGNLTGIDMSKPYSITKFEIGFNHIGGTEKELTIGGMYSIIVDSPLPFVKHGITGETKCFKVIPGDFNANGMFDSDEIVMLRKHLIGYDIELNAIGDLRKENCNITSLVSATLGLADTSNKGSDTVYPNIFSADIGSTYGATVYDKVYMNPDEYQIIAQDYDAYREKGDAFAAEVLANQIGTFEKTGIDKMCHVSTFYYSHGNIYCSYYANSISAAENPEFQVARLAYAPEETPEKKVIVDIMQVGDELYGKKITGVYDTILMPKEDEPDNLYILWTAAVEGEYYRMYQVFNMKTEELGPIGVNRFKVGNTVNDFSRNGMKKALNKEGHGYKEFASDIGIMQKLSTRVENGETYYYTGAYCCDFTCIIKSKDLITWEYVAQPNEGANGTGFENCTRWENAVYVVGDKVYYYVRQWDPLGVQSNGLPTDYTVNRTQNGSYYGILTAYNLVTGEWDKPILVEDCQSRSDFIMYKGNLYLIYAPTPEYGGNDRQHLGILKIDTNDLSKTTVVLQAQIGTSCFYPFWQFNSDGELCISYTYARKEIRLTSINLSKYLD